MGEPRDRMQDYFLRDTKLNHDENGWSEFMTKVIDNYQYRAGPHSMDEAEERQRPSVGWR